MVDATSIVNGVCGQLTTVGFRKNKVPVNEVNKAIEDAVNQAIKEAEKEADAAKKALNQAHTNAMNAANKAHSQAMSRLTEEKELLQQQLAEAQRPLAKRPHIIFGEPKVLPNGNIETVKTSALTGGRMTIETLSDGETVISRLVETVNGDKRKTFYDPVTQDPIKTFTNTRRDGDVLIEYTPNGHKITRVNNKKVKPEKPVVVNREKLTSNDGLIPFRETYSDGSYKILKFGRDPNIPVLAEHYDRQNRLLSKFDNHWYSGQKETSVLKKYNPETGKETSVKTTEYTNVNGVKKISKEWEDLYDETGKNAIQKTVFDAKTGLKKIAKYPQNQYGLVGDCEKMRVIYPDTSKIKKATILYSGGSPVKETMTLRDGTKVVADIDHNRWDISEITITPPNGEVRKLSCKSEQHKEIEEYLSTIGRSRTGNYDYYTT